MTIAQQGQVNVSALSVPQPLIQIVPPQFLFGGVSTNICGHVGTASWGPVNLAQNFGSYQQYTTVFGPTMNRTNDMGAQVSLACAQGASAHFGVRVTDGTDVAATSNCNPLAASGTITFSGQPAANDTVTIGTTVVTFKASGAVGNQVNIGATQAATVLALLAFLQASADAQLVQCAYTLTSASVIGITFKIGGIAGNTFALVKSSTNIAVSGATLAGGSASTYGMVLTGKYTGSLGNSLKAIVSAGTQSTSWKVILSLPGFTPEVFDNIGAGTTGAAAWTAIVAAINSGLSGTRGPSQLAVATTGASTQSPVSTPTTNTFSSGTDGVSSITSGILVGTDGTGSTRTGMYALRGTNVSQFAISDLSDSTVWSSILTFALDIEAYAIVASPSGDTITNAAQTLATAGIDNYGLKVIFGDWVVWYDTTNGVPQRVSSPAGVTLGLLGNLSPQNNTLNKAINGIVGTQSAITGKKYSYSDLQALAAARMDVICVDPQLGSSSFIHRLGINTSSNPIIFGDEYTRITYFLAKSLERIAGQYVGQVQTPTERRQAKVSIQEFLALAQSNGIIGTADGSQAFQVILDSSINTPTSVALGYQYAQVKAIYQGIVRYFVVNLEGGSSVSVSNTPIVQ